MVEKNTGINQDEADDFTSLWESDLRKERTEEGFVPTHDELIALVKYWFKNLLGSLWVFDFSYSTYGRDIWEERVFANRRINRIRKIVGNAKVDEAIEEVRNDFRAGKNEKLWAVFEGGDEAQRAAVAEETHAILTGDERPLASLTYVDFPESFSPDRTKRISLSLTSKELADLEAASRRLSKSVGEILRKGAASFISNEKSKIETGP